MNLQEKTLAELAQGETGIATLRVGNVWRRGLVFENSGEKFFACRAEAVQNYEDEKIHPSKVYVLRFRVLNNGVKVGSEVLAIPAVELKALLSGVENG